MSDYNRCKKCGNYGWMSTHTCPPAWECEYEDCGSQIVYAHDPESAAEKYAECYLDEDYDMSLGEDYRVRVQELMNPDNVSFWLVTCELERSYYTSMDDDHDPLRRAE